LALADHGRKE
ncbi:hypothetical protein A2U01_0075895, partial [Trifolium medium]|nr:hypothetical protein [Trifolium medium]